MSRSLRPPRTVLTAFSKHSAASEAYKLLRSNLRFASIDKPLTSLAVTSALPTEGKTLTAANLAISMAQAGARTLLVDADLRKPAQHKVFVLRNSVGLTSVLIGSQKFDDAVQDTAHSDLSILTTGEKAPNPAELIQSESMSNLHRLLTARFDLVIYDCPPVLPAVEASTLSAMADGSLVVIRAGATPKEAVRQALYQLELARAKVLGAVLNGARAGGGYGYQYYSYAYGSK